MLLLTLRSLTPSLIYPYSSYTLVVIFHFVSLLHPSLFSSLTLSSSSPLNLDVFPQKRATHTSTRHCAKLVDKSNWGRENRRKGMMDRVEFWFCSRRLSSAPVADGWGVIVELFHEHLRWMDKQQCPFRRLSIFFRLDPFCCPHCSPTHTQGAHQIRVFEY